MIRIIAIALLLLPVCPAKAHVNWWYVCYDVTVIDGRRVVTSWTVGGRCDHPADMASVPAKALREAQAHVANNWDGPICFEMGWRYWIVGSWEEFSIVAKADRPAVPAGGFMGDR